MAETSETKTPVKLNTDYKKATGVECTIMRLNSTPNKYGSYSYALIKGELPKGVKTYGKEGRVIFYVNKCVGGHLVNHVANLAGVENTNPTTGEVTIRCVIMRSEAEIKKEETFRAEVSNDAKEASAFGLTRQQLGNQYFTAKYGAKFGSKSTPEQSQSAEA